MTNSRASRAQASCHFSSVICHWSFRGRAGSGSLGTPLSERQCPRPPLQRRLCRCPGRSLSNSRFSLHEGMPVPTRPS